MIQCTSPPSPQRATGARDPQRIISQHEKYGRRSFRRCHIIAADRLLWSAGACSVQLTSIPLLHSCDYRSHFGSRYKLGCCGHAGLFCRGSEACIRARPTPCGKNKLQRFRSRVFASVLYFVHLSGARIGRRKRVEWRTFRTLQR